MRETEEVIVVGAGIVGLTAAWALRRAGITVRVLERGGVGQEASGRNAGLIGGDRPDEPDVFAALRRDSRTFFDELHERGHDIGLDRTGTLTLIATDEEWAWADGAVAARRAAGGVHELIDGARLGRLEPTVSRALLGAVLDPLGARADPTLTMRAIAAEARTAGVVIESEHAATGFRTTALGGWIVETRDSEVAADAVVLATGAWTPLLAAMTGVALPIVAVRGQMWASPPSMSPLRHGIVAAESAQHWDREVTVDGEPPLLTHRDGVRQTRHLYACQRSDGSIVVGGDREVTTDPGVDTQGVDVNRHHAAELIPSLGAASPTRTWSGLMPFTLDGRPLIGPVPERPGLFVASGLASSGFGRGPATGELIADLVAGNTPAHDLSPVSLRAG